MEYSSSNKSIMPKSSKKKPASAYMGPPERKRKELQKMVDGIKREWLKKGVTVKKVVIDGEVVEGEAVEEEEENDEDEESDEDEKKKINDSV
ncbi:F-actin-monooxygenase MICAL3-like [Papaver somniferum]|uniref:F-actin-monooxygenase MICAL3-like n=1 Tax=Papaver somniferum TaxID=3469 RepID=UPI000E6FE135|nr:F-actin-monooxygenase MICAL3-like [Papaver somniferum]